MVSTHFISPRRLLRTACDHKNSCSCKLCDLGGHLFVLFEAKAVAYDFSLDGNLFEESHSVSRRPLVGQAAVGFALQGTLFGRRTKLAVMRVFKAREFNEQSSRHAYGSMALSIDL